MLASSKLNSIESKISKALIYIYIYIYIYIMKLVMKTLRQLLIKK